MLFYRVPKAPDMQLQPGTSITRVHDVAVLWAAGSALAEQPARSTITELLASAPAVRTRFSTSTTGRCCGRARGGVSHHRCGDRVGHRRHRQPNRVPRRRRHGRSARRGDGLLARGVAVAVVKLGGDGVLVASPEGRIVVPPQRVEVVCGLGAGDAFGGAFVHGLLAGWPPARIVEYANAAGAIVAGRLLCADAMPTEPRSSEMLQPREESIVRRLDDNEFAALTAVRVDAPERIAKALAERPRRQRLTVAGTLFIVAADHTARGMIGVPGQPRAMADRRTMLERLLVALDNPRVDGVLGSADVIEDLVYLGALDGKVAVGTMNRGGLAGATWEIDDRFTAYDADHLVAANLDAGKMLLRIDPGIGARCRRWRRAPPPSGRSTTGG